MGFILKYSALTWLSIYFVWSLFISVNGLVDVMGDVHGLNYTTRIHLEDMVVSDNNSLVYESTVAKELDPATVPIPGYGLYWAMMTPVSSWFQPHVYQLVKLSLVTVSLVSVLASALALLSHALYCTGHSAHWPAYWLGHPTPLLLAELSVMLALSQALVMIFLGSPVVSGLMGAQGMLQVSGYFLFLMGVFSLVGNLYKVEREMAEEKAMEYETVIISSGDEASDSEQDQRGVNNGYIGN